MCIKKHNCDQSYVIYFYNNVDLKNPTWHYRRIENHRSIKCSIEFAQFTIVYDLPMFECQYSNYFQHGYKKIKRIECARFTIIYDLSRVDRVKKIRRIICSNGTIIDYD